jgi:hypothetical protein
VRRTGCRGVARGGEPERTDGCVAHRFAHVASMM